MIKLLLVLTGFLAAIAVFVRGSVLLGLYLGILPGLVLAVAPTIFLYLLTFWVLRTWLPLPAGFAVNAAAAALTFALGVGIALPGAISGRAAFAAATTGDIVPAEPVKLAGHIVLERHGRVDLATSRNSLNKALEPCDAVCAALLDTPGILSVTLTGSDFTGKPFVPVTYRLVPKAQAPGPGLTPQTPEVIVNHLPKPVGPRPAGMGIDAENAANEALRKSVSARWAMRLATEQTLVAEPNAPAADFVIVLKDLSAAGPALIAITETEVRNASGKALFRRQRVTARVVSVPFYLAPEGSMMDQGFGMGRSLFHTNGRWGEVKPFVALFEGTNMARPALDPAAVVSMRTRLAAAIGGQGPAGDLSMVAPWIAMLDWRKLDEADVDLLAALISDPKVAGLDKLYDGYSKYVAPRLRRPIAIRLLDAGTTGALRWRLNDLVRKMPVGTYADLLPEEEALLANQAQRLTASALVARQADRGAAAVPLLIALLREDVQVPVWANRQWMMADLRRAFAQLGPQAAAALPLVEQLFAQQRNPLANEWREAQAWRVAMVRMGKPIDSLPFPPSFKPEQIARERADIARMVARPIDPTEPD